MGDKRRKKRRGLTPPRHGKPHVEAVELRHGVRVEVDAAETVMVVTAGDFIARVDLADGTIRRKAAFTLSGQQRDTITGVVLDSLAKRGLEPADPLDVRDALFAGDA